MDRLIMGNRYRSSCCHFLFKRIFAYLFTISTYFKINDQEYGRGLGSSKKKAEQAAAQETLELVGEV